MFSKFYNPNAGCSDLPERGDNSFRVVIVFTTTQGSSFLATLG